MPTKVASFCVDPKATAYGKDAAKGIHDICDVFDGECEIYLGLGIQREVELRYAGGSAAIAAHLSRFDTPDHAYAMFTKRTVGDSDPALDSTPKPLPLDGARAGTAALGVGNALLVKGTDLLELTYNDSKLNEAALESAANTSLPELVRAVAGKIPDADIPRAVTLLPIEERIPMGVRLIDADLLGDKASGGGAFGYHKTSNGARYRSLIAVRADAVAAKATFQALKGAGTPVPSLGEEAVRVEKHDGPVATEWLIARKDALVIGIGDESRVLRDGMPEKERAGLCLPLDEKKTKLGTIIAATK